MIYEKKNIYCRSCPDFSLSAFPGCKKKPAQNPFTQKEESGQFGNKVKALTPEEIIEKQTKEKLTMENFGITNEMSGQLARNFWR